MFSTHIPRHYLQNIAHWDENIIIFRVRVTRALDYIFYGKSNLGLLQKSSVNWAMGTLYGNVEAKLFFPLSVFFIEKTGKR